MNPFSPWFGRGKKGKTLVAIGSMGVNRVIWLKGTGVGTGVKKKVSCPLGLLHRPLGLNEAPGRSVHSSAKLPCLSAADGTVAGTVSPWRLRKPSEYPNNTSLSF